ncbi:MAG: ATP-binding protein [Armatimonadota bacterium]|nr:ATP-binding protein [Armatimonadota bacterium]
MPGRRLKIVISGGSHSGKTTLLQALAAMGYKTIPEAAMLVIEDLNRRLGIEGQSQWRQAHPADFQSMVADRQLRLEASLEDAADSPVFLDRGLLDGLAYCEFRHIAAPPVLTSVSLHERYSHVFVLATIIPYESRSETGRTGTGAASQTIGQLIFQTYAAYGYTPRWVEQMPVQERAAFILQQLDG